ncbi:TRAP transporter small permease [Dermabacter hominis]|uniref:TRAP transporter small permease n=1 Tax=Dermabacter hominis TaxID=36740 RepID=UPI00223B026C|nr:TRAP transporter small permease [Dermabacter hominis]MCT2024677.1 TRAP transporter small permease [Dermabacter hominis]
MSTSVVPSHDATSVSALRRSIIEVLKWVSIAIFAVLVLVVLWQVIARQVLGQPSTWSTTVAQYMLVWLTLFSMAFVFAERGHVAVDIVSRLAPPAVQKVLAVLVEVAIALFAGLGLVWGGIRGVGLTWTQAIPGLPVTIGHMYIALPVCGVIVVVVAVMDLIDASKYGVLASLEPQASDGIPAPAIPRQSADAGPHSAHRSVGGSIDTTEV